MAAWFLAGIVVGVALAAAVAVFLWGREVKRSATARREQAAALAELQSQLTHAQLELQTERALVTQRQVAWEEAQRQLTGAFAELSAKALQHNNSQFLELANARLKESQQLAQSELEQRKQAIEHLLAPLREQLNKYEEGLRQLELERQKAYTSLVIQVQNLTESEQRLQAETRNLVTALRSPSTRGRWGELQLRRVVEVAGMVEHCDFEVQVPATTEDGRQRPDMVVHLPGSKLVIVDAKVPLQAFLDANDATDEATRRSHLVNHARQLRAHVDLLASKAYWQPFDQSPEFVVAFVPGEALLSAAFEQDPHLLEHALTKRVLLATPVNLIALLRTVAASWQQEVLTENAREVQQVGRDLYRRLSVFGEHLAKTGKGLSTAVEAYNKAVGSLERSVLPQARRFQELGVVGDADKDIPELEAVASVPREPQAPELTPTALVH
jgi:DNA recombination protein RmuC